MQIVLFDTARQGKKKPVLNLLPMHGRKAFL